MSKKSEFPVMSTMITGILFILGLLIITLGVLLRALALSTPGFPTVLVPIFWFIGLFLFGWSLLSFSLNHDLEDFQRNTAFFFLVILVTAIFAVGLGVTVSVA